jgi:glutathione S-transferase
MTELRIFSYLPNPRIWKATIAARLAGVTLEVRGGASRDLQQWLWDFDARPISAEERATLAGLERTPKVGFRDAPILKTDTFLDAHPFGTVPAAFSPGGEVGIFESNSIMRAVARLGRAQSTLYGRDAYEASRIDSFLDASLVFARDAQLYLLALLGKTVDAGVHVRARNAFQVYMAGIDRALAPARDTIVGDDITLADICFVAELCLFSNERNRREILRQHGLAPILDAEARAACPRAWAHFDRLCAHPAFAPDVGDYMKKLAA